jgi:hypothetical protein
MKGTKMNPVTMMNGILAAMPSASAVASSVATGAIGTVILSGLQSSGGQNALDPLHLIFKPNVTTTTAAGATTVAPTPTISAAAFASLPPATQQMLLAQGAHIS